ncbi:MAG: rod shape-determining protein MreD [Clostridiales Family XIII bacterium]|jgi:rod shape-determining protein MreD|nr:rod shape-determining protein MreD [Clostridiales Family XIII bacterium]
MSRMHYYIAVPFFLLLYFLQTTLIWRLSAENFAPNLLLVATSVFSFLYNERYGLVLGVSFGLLLDITTSPVLGVQALSFLLIFIMVRLFRLILNNEKLLPNVLMALLATPVGSLLYWAVGRMAGYPTHIKYVFETMPRLLLWHAILAAVLHLLFVKTVIRHRGDRKFESEFEL